MKFRYKPVFFVDPLVSITITTKDEEKNIENCFLSIKEQSYPNIEIILVDNNSKDKTVEIGRKFTDKIFCVGPERSVQRNHGMIKVSKGEYVMFVDADMVLSPTLIEGCVEKIRQGSFAALHIPEIILGKTYFSKVRRFERGFYDGTLIDGARFFVRETFESVKGFDETMTGPEDWDIDKKIKGIGKIGLLDKAPKQKNKTEGWLLREFIVRNGVDPEKYANVIYHNEALFNLRKYLSKKGYYAKNFDLYISKWGKDDPDLRNQFGVKYRFFDVFFEKGKWKNLLSYPNLTFGMYFLRFLVGVKFLLRGVR